MKESEIANYVRGQVPAHFDIISDCPIDQDALVFIIKTTDGAKTAVLAISGLEIVMNNEPQMMIGLLDERLKVVFGELQCVM